MGSGEDKIELSPDAWEQFERAVDAVSKGGPQHRSAHTQTETIKPNWAKRLFCEDHSRVPPLRSAEN